MNFKEYPRLQKFMSEHPSWTLDDVLNFTENELLKKERQGNGQQPK